MPGDCSGIMKWRPLLPQNGFCGQVACTVNLVSTLCSVQQAAGAMNSISTSVQLLENLKCDVTLRPFQRLIKYLKVRYA